MGSFQVEANCLDLKRLRSKELAAAIAVNCWRQQLQRRKAMNMIPRHDHLLGLSPTGFHKVAYVDWRRDSLAGANGTENRPKTAVCVHGLLLNSRAFVHVPRT